MPVFRSFVAAAAFASFLSTSAYPQSQKPAQYVVISFDGAHDIGLWERSRALAAETGAHFTYFLSCVFLLSQESKSAYRGPHHSAGKSNVGFAASPSDVAARLEQIWTARSEGHEIGSHGCGHFDGKAWTAADWASEFTSFNKILSSAYEINDLEGEPTDWRRFVDGEITGFRAPYLSTSKELNAALAQAGFDYDASSVSDGPVPAGHSGRVPLYALPMIPEGPKSRPVIAMDYNLYVRHSGGKDDNGQSAVFSERSYEAFKKAFAQELDGKRRPLQIGFHFVLMNNGAYWDALERFVREVCVRPDTECVSYRELQAANQSTQGAGG